MANKVAIAELEVRIKRFYTGEKLESDYHLFDCPTCGRRVGIKVGPEATHVRHDSDKCRDILISWPPSTSEVDLIDEAANRYGWVGAKDIRQVTRYLETTGRTVVTKNEVSYILMISDPRPAA